jgi:hypothetical protein
MQRTFATIVFASWLLLIMIFPAQAETIFVVTGPTVSAQQYILSFDSSNPATTSVPKLITGLVPPFEQIFNIDFRPATGQLYGLTQLNRLYRLDPATGIATFVPTQIPTFNFSQMLGIDFNPVLDELRIVNSASQNFRVNVDTGTVIQESSVRFAPGDPTTGIISPFAANITSIAYTNSFAGAASATLYGIETNLRILVTQSPEEQGLLHTVGPLVVDALNGTFVGFDISSSTGIGYATFLSVFADPPVDNNFYTIDLSTGRATLLGPIGDGSFAVADLAVSVRILADLCLQDDSNGNILQINSTTGRYQFTSCSGLSFGGIGMVTRKGGIITLQHYASDRRVLARIDLSANRGTASIQLLSQGSTFTIIDRNTANNTCTCR